MFTQIKKCVKVLASTIKNSSGRAKQGMFAGVAIIAIFASLSFTGTRIAYNVNYGGNIIATVSQKKHFNDALQLVTNMVGDGTVQEVVDKPTFNAAVVLTENINNTQELADAIISNTEAIVEGAALVVDGCVVAYAEKTMLDTALSERLSSFNVEGQVCESRFLNNIEFETGYFLTSELDNDLAVKGVINSLSVVTEMRQVSEVIVPYKSVVQKTNEQVIGYSKVSVTGVSGVNRVTQDVVMVNGEIQSCVDVSNEILVDPVNEVIVKGTAKTQASAKQKQQAHAAGFTFPLPEGSWKVSAYYGDGRNHKGIDLSAKSGTSILAAADGKVVHAGWKGDFGYCVIIEHSNGMRTLYAHARQVCCSVGDTVSQGEVVALVGTTGQSTGNHLHFEVIVNGKRIDPAPYINLD